MTPGAVVVGAHINGLGVIRALGPRGVPTAVVSTRPYDFAQHSRWVSERHELREFPERPESLVEFLEQNASRWSGWAVFPTTDDALTVLAQHHEQLSRTYRLPLEPWEVAARCVDKDRLHALAQEVGLELPLCHGPATADTAAKPLRYPVVVKPIQHDRLLSSFGTKLFLAHDAEQLRTSIERLRQVGLRGLVFDYVPGPDSQLYVYCVHVDGRGEPSPGITVRKLRQNPPLTGGPRVCEVVDDIPALREATIELLRQAGVRGLAYAEFKLDPRDGRFVFIEVNCRTVALDGVLPPTGIDLVSKAWSELALGEPLPLRPTGWCGCWIHLQADVACSLRERLSLGELSAPYRRPTVFADWSASDPRPFLAQTSIGLRAAVRH
jgi:predicted ATP-grasp superfamily ATP-dependent carboligase